jgi:hypothetical protein
MWKFSRCDLGEHYAREASEASAAALCKRACNTLWQYHVRDAIPTGESHTRRRHLRFVLPSLGVEYAFKRKLYEQRMTTR